MMPTAPVRFSHLKQLALSPLHYWHATQAGWTDTASTRVGSAAHAVLFETPHVVFPGARRAGKEWEAFADANCDRLILSRGEADTAGEIASAIEAHQLAWRLLRTDAEYRERRVEWTLHGWACAGTPDAWSDSYIVDLKTARCAEPSRFMRDAQYRAYHAQVAWYHDGLAARDSLSRTPYIIAVENKAPYAVSVLELDAATMDAGRRLYRLWLEQLAVCVDSGVWPGYSSEPVRWKIETDVEYVGLEDDDAE